jgi:hypothetical protein
MGLRSTSSAEGADHMLGDLSVPPVRDLPPGRKTIGRRHLLAEIAPPQRQRFFWPSVSANRAAILGAALVTAVAASAAGLSLTVWRGSPDSERPSVSQAAHPSPRNSSQARFHRSEAGVACGAARETIFGCTPGAVASTGARSCGTLSAGIGWHLRASSNLGCSPARHLMVTYFGQERRQKAVVLGYVCTRRDLPDAEHVRCSRRADLVTAKSFGY